MSNQYNAEEFVPISSIAKQAALDTYADFEAQQARYTAWAIRGLKKLVAQTLRSGKRYAILNVNKNLNNAVLPCDFKEELFVGIINECGDKVALTINQNIVNTQLIEDVPCENECDKNCGCYPKQMCQDLQTTQVINKILINDTYYDETVTSTLLPSGEYYVVRTTPYLDTVDGGINYITTKEYETTLDVADCGCIQQTQRNICKLENMCPDVYCCYCKQCNSNNSDFGGYKIFRENNTIQFDRGVYFTKVYMEYRGFLPKSGNEYLVPEVAFETLVNFTKFKSVENKKGVAMNDRLWHWERYLVEMGNMNKIIGRMGLSDIIHSALLVPTFDYNANSCYVPSAGTATNTPKPPSYITDAPAPTPQPPDGGVGTTECNPAIITTNGQEMEGGTKYHNGSLIGVPFRVFAGPFNRYLTTDEYNVLATGGFEVLTGVYGLNDEFDVFPKWCDANVADIPDAVIMGMRNLVIKVDGLQGSPVAGENTYTNAGLIGADVQNILVNKAPETLVDGDFEFTPVTGTLTRPANVWQPLDTAIIYYTK